jgi:hypothetical protein
LIKLVRLYVQRDTLDIGDKETRERRKEMEPSDLEADAADTNKHNIAKQIEDILNDHDFELSDLFRASRSKRLRGAQRRCGC